MILNEISGIVLLKIGLSPGISAFTIASELERDQAGINRVCKKLREGGFVAATEALNVKNARVLELRLTLRGFAHAVHLIYCDIHHPGKSLDDTEKFKLLLDNNRDLHGTIDIFMECMHFAVEKGTRDAIPGVLKTGEHITYRCAYEEVVEFLFESFVCRLGRYLEDYSGAISLTKPTKNRKKCISMEFFRETDWEDVHHAALYVDLFFDFAKLFNPSTFYGKIYGDKLIQMFKESEGWPSILKAIEHREAEYARFQALKARI